MYKQVNTKIMKKNSQIVVRMPKDTILKYNKFCNKNNSLMSIRIRKFIELELLSPQKGIDLFKELDKYEL